VTAHMTHVTDPKQSSSAIMMLGDAKRRRGQGGRNKAGRHDDVK